VFSCYYLAVTFRNKRRNTLYCFSPPVMLATFAIEIGLAVFTIWRYRLSTTARLVLAVLGFLALFQLSEYFVCGGSGLDAMQWSRTGYAAITMLPPLGLHLLHVLAGRKQRRLVSLAYVTAAGFISFFLLHEQAFSGHVCAGNYVIFQLVPLATNLYAAYYYGWLLTAMLLGARWLDTLTKPAMRRAVQGLLVGYLVFLVPTGIATVLNPAVLSGIPSVMCGFAVLFALILVFYVLPQAARVKGLRLKR
jgi:hypothetical protein